MTRDERDGRAGDATGSDAREPATTTRPEQREADQNWLLGPGVDREHRDRQILVVGDTTVGRTLTLLLQRAGYDPLLVRDAGRSAESRTTFLCPPACRALRSLGLTPTLTDEGVPIRRVSVRRDTPGSRQETTLSAPAESGAARPVAIETRDLGDALAEQLPNRQRCTDRALAAVSTGDDGLAIEFEDGIREWFDVLVDTSGDGLARQFAADRSPEQEPLVQYETSVAAETLPSNQLRETWRPSALVQVVPTSEDSTAILRLTAPRATLPSSDEDEAIRTFVEETTAELATGPVSVDDFERATTVRQVRQPDEHAHSAWWGTGLISVCGPACPTAPASEFTTWFGIESALALVSELTGADRPASDVIETYSTRRLRRFRSLRQTLREVRRDHEYPVPDSAPEPLDTIGEFRQLTLSRFLDERLRSLQRDGFG
ncbi:FAD-dependent monooxygenase [Haloarcula litorea]|uniref:FAD-dependent monooxygenase n=1 Tax=Haloarcula litorea TaxID=3032579 RepID=UPI0023E7A4DA|nr:hypothetical protein [Halomicroarcula sp. GDY20]